MAGQIEASPKATVNEVVAEFLSWTEGHRSPLNASEDPTLDNITQETARPGERSRKLTPFEQYMLDDDCERFPMCFFVQLRVRGSLDLANFEAVAKATARRHPLLASFVSDTVGGVPAWTTATGEPRIHSISDREPFIRLTSERGVRIGMSHATGGNEFLLRFQIHHACCDARGTLSFIHEVLSRYDATERVTGSFVGKSASRRDADPEAGHTPPRRVLQSLRDAVRIWNFFGRRVRSLSRVDSRLASGLYPSHLAYSLDAVETQGLLATARALGARLNDLLLHGAFVSLESWLRNRAATEGRGVLRVAVPIDMRTSNETDCRCENVVSMVFLDRTRAAIEARDSLLQGIVAEMTQIKADRMGFAMLRALRLLAWLPRGLKPLLSSNRCWATTVVSNLGTIFTDSPLADSQGRLRFGGAVVEEVDFLPPFRRWTPAVFGAATYAGMLRLTLHYDAAVFNAEDASELLQACVAHLRTSTSNVP